MKNPSKNLRVIVDWLYKEPLSCDEEPLIKPHEEPSEKLSEELLQCVEEPFEVPFKEHYKNPAVWRKLFEEPS